MDEKKKELIQKYCWSENGTDNKYYIGEHNKSLLLFAEKFEAMINEEVIAFLEDVISQPTDDIAAEKIREFIKKLKG